MCVLYVSLGSKVRPRTFGCVAMGRAVLFILRSRLLVYCAGSGENRVQVVLSGFSVRLCVMLHPCMFCVALSMDLFVETIRNMFECVCYFVVACYGVV